MDIYISHTLHGHKTANKTLIHANLFIYFSFLFFFHAGQKQTYVMQVNQVRTKQNTLPSIKDDSSSQLKYIKYIKYKIATEALRGSSQRIF
jgi:hypothetical protein